MDWTQISIIIGSVGFMILGTFLVLNQHIRATKDGVGSIDKRMDGHAQRIDQLYQLYIDVLKSRK